MFSSKTGLSVSGYLIEERINADHTLPIQNSDKSLPWSRTYFGKIGLRLDRAHAFVITPESIIINNDTIIHGWDHTLQPTRFGDFVIGVNKKKELVIDRGDDVVLVIMLHHVRVRNGEDMTATREVHYLGFYVEEGRGLSDKVHGLIGMSVL